MNTERNETVVHRLFDEIWKDRNCDVVDEEMLVLTFKDAGRVVHQRGIVDSLAALRQAGVMPTPEQ